MTKKTILGMEVGHFISLLTLFGVVIASWISMNIRITNAENKTEFLEAGRLHNAQTIETNRIETRNDIKEILRKQDSILVYLAIIKYELRNIK